MATWQPQQSAQPALASDGAAQPSSLRRALDGKLYTRAEFHEYYGFYWGESLWQSAPDELTQCYRPADASATGPPRLCNAEQQVWISSIAQWTSMDQRAAQLHVCEVEQGKRIACICRLGEALVGRVLRQGGAPDILLSLCLEVLGWHRESSC